MAKRRQINAGPGAPRLRSALSAGLERLRALAYALEEGVLWRGADWLRTATEHIRWPIERIAWPIERRLVWPLQERAAGRGVSGRIAGAATLAAVGAAAALIGALALSGGGTGAGEPVAAPRVAVLTDSERVPVQRPRGPVLQGAAPSFPVGETGEGAAPEAAEGAAPAEAAPSTAGPEAGAEAEAAATTSKSKKPVPAGPAAMKVARRFTEAFVFYEIGERPKRAKTVFGETATPRLAAALGERPPRQPAGVDVPQARVLNLVPGPRHGKTYTLSVSLLRVGTTSELRLEMRKVNGNWVVTDVRG